MAARLRNGAPLVVERSFGKGRVMAFLTTAAPTWNNWARNPSFVVADAGLAGVSVASGPARGQSRLVGSPLELSLDPAAYQPQVRFTTPETGAAAIDRRQRGSRRPAERLTASLPDTDVSGFYEARLDAQRRRARRLAATRSTSIRPRATWPRSTPSSLPPGWRASSISTSRPRRSSRPSATLPGYNLGEAAALRAGLAAVGRADPGLVGQLPPGRRRRALAQGGAA